MRGLGETYFMKTIKLKPGKDKAVRRFHPWIFSGALMNFTEAVDDGELVRVVDPKGNFLACGHFHNGSIAVRILTFEDEAIDQNFWNKRLQNAYTYRKTIGLPKVGLTNCYRLIHAEGDGLPGLIVDVYCKVAVVQCHSIGMHLAVQQISNAILALEDAGIRAVYDKSAETLPANYAAQIQNVFIMGYEQPEPIIENGIRFIVDWEEGQKTGFFLDQRANRELLEKYCKGKTVLNCFSYSGGFSMYALRAGATKVHSVDASDKAIEWCRKNGDLNFPEGEQHEAFISDVMEYLKQCAMYDVMVVDPPAFAKSMSKRHNAVQGYKRLNMAAIRKVKPGGVLFTFSCSQVVDRDLFYNTIVAAALESGRQLRVMHHLSQPPDHPVNIFHPEGAYLKGLALQVL